MKYPLFILVSVTFIIALIMTVMSRDDHGQVDIPLNDDTFFPGDTPAQRDEVINVSIQSAVDDAVVVSLPGESYEEIADEFYQIDTGDISESAPFDIMIDGVTGAVLVVLYREPLGEVRQAAEMRLRLVLNQDDTSLCNMAIRVFTNQYVNTEYAAYDNLGLSFCPVHVPLD